MAHQQFPTKAQMQNNKVLLSLPLNDSCEGDSTETQDTNIAGYSGFTLQTNIAIEFNRLHHVNVMIDASEVWKEYIR